MPGLPCKEVINKHGRFFEIDRSSNKNMIWITVLDEAKYEGNRYSWLSPVHCYVAGHSDYVIKCKAVGDPEPLICCAARLGFHKLPQTPILQLMRHRGVEIPGASFFDQLAALIKSVLKKVKDEDLYEILKLRTVDPGDETLQLFDEVGLEELYDDDKETAKEVASFKEHLMKEKDVIKDFKVSLSSMSENP